MSRQHEFILSDSIQLLCVSQHNKIPENSEIHTAQNCVACSTYCKFTWINVISSMIVSLHKNMWKDTVRNAAVHKIMWPAAFAVNSHEIMSSAAWLQPIRAQIGLCGSQSEHRLAGAWTICALIGWSERACPKSVFFRFFWGGGERPQLQSALS